MGDKKEFSLVTVNMLTYKKLDYLEAALNSVFVQDYQNIEIIISDDGSPNFYKEYIENIINK
jgi:glycosyltransferase involved in cell wall biosynthesis